MMNTYEERLERRRERLEARAMAKRGEAKTRWAESDHMARMMNGQPVLIGHHSEKRHRRDIDRMWNHGRKGLEAYNEAEKLERRAAAVGSAGISADDPEAVAKLKTKLAKLEANQEMMKRANKLVRAKKVDELGELLGEKVAIGLMNPDFAGRLGFPAYCLSNNNANMKRIRDRIAMLEREQERPETEAIEGDGWTLSEDAEDNRIKFEFEGKPPAETRALLKSRGFRWSRHNMAWQRQLNNAGRWAAEQVAKELRG